MINPIEWIHFIYLIVRIAWHQRVLNFIWRGVGVGRLRFIFDARALQIESQKIQTLLIHRMQSFRNALCWCAQMRYLVNESYLI